MYGYCIGAGYGTDAKPSTCGKIVIAGEEKPQSFFEGWWTYSYPPES
jgi:hypothetical protein